MWSGDIYERFCGCGGPGGWLDPETGEKVSVQSPEDVWSDHFDLSEGKIVRLTPIGRATARLLNMNHPRRVELTLQWLAEGAQSSSRRQDCTHRRTFLGSGIVSQPAEVFPPLSIRLR